jgi:hypothetical protein
VSGRINLGLLDAKDGLPSVAAQGRNGGRYKDRTCDPYDVNVVLSR